MSVSPILILASRSPRRRELLRDAGYRFEVMPPLSDREESHAPGEPVTEYVIRLARAKAADVALQVTGMGVQSDEDSSEIRSLTAGSNESAHSNAGAAGRVIVACDTLAECAGEILGKPANEHDARRMLTLLAGRRHHVHSGICLWSLGGARPRTAVATTTLEMAALDSQAIDEYIATGLWQGKAGAFGYQDRLDWLRIIEGSESNVVGLPLELLATMLHSPESHG